MTRLLISTDLDGTLLDHHSYSADAAEPMLGRLQALDVPCILNTSKTFAELEPLRRQLGHRDPFIVENGAAVCIPCDLPLGVAMAPLQSMGNYRYQCFGPDRSDILAQLKKLSGRFRFTGFASLSVDELVDCTGLNPAAAALALQRQFTEPLIWEDSDEALEDFAEALASSELQLQRGGRFIHVMGHCDKGEAMRWLARQYQSLWDEKVVVMALGDGENDVSMLQQADFPVVVRSPVHEPPQVPGHDDVLITDRPGPEGWADAVGKALQKLGLD